MIKYGFKIRTRSGMLVDHLAVAARDRAAAEQKVNKMYHHCEILECQELRPPAARDDSLDLEDVIALIGRQEQS